MALQLSFISHCAIVPMISSIPALGNSTKSPEINSLDAFNAADSIIDIDSRILHCPPGSDGE